MSADPLRQFEREHAEALEVLEVLERAATALEEGGDPAPHLAEARVALEFIQSAVRRHNEAEERALFPFIEDALPAALFVEEHVRLRALEETLDAALAGTDPAHHAVEPALELVALLREHIERENNVLFPAARTLLGTDGLVMVARRLESGQA
ncbi:MAG TPA: hemerythrin domain-containing protein [Gemmatimonadales bacterium]|nr:hemerythrin domain-containing protein [Gemmatimonadales bacterium]